jgi:hypothetical protein
MTTATLPALKTVPAFDVIEAWVDAQELAAARKALAEKNATLSSVKLTDAQVRTLRYILAKGGVSLDALHMGSVKTWGECRKTTVFNLFRMGLVERTGTLYFVSAAGCMAVNKAEG